MPKLLLPQDGNFSVSVLCRAHVARVWRQWVAPNDARRRGGGWRDLYVCLLVLGSWRQLPRYLLGQTLAVVTAKR